MRVLIALGDASAAESYGHMLRSEGFNVEHADSDDEAVDLARIYAYDVIVLGDLADASVETALTNIRRAGVTTPILAVSSCFETKFIVDLLHRGADNHMTLPGHKDVLVAHLYALIRRSQGHAQSVLTVGPISLDLHQKQVYVSGYPLQLTSKEYDMLEILVHRQGQTVTKDALLNHLYGGRDEPELKIIDVFLCKIRKKLRLAGADGHIYTVWGRGYSIREEATAVVRPRQPVLERAESSRLSVLRAIAREDGQTVASLSERLAMGENTVRAAAGWACRNGLVVDLALMKRDVFRLTDKGREWLAGPEAARLAS